MPKKKDSGNEKLNHTIIRKEKRKLLKVMFLLAKVYKKNAKSKEERAAYSEIEDELKEARKKI